MSDVAPPSTAGELRTLVRLALPIALAQVGLISMALVDTAVLGRVSVDDLAGAGMGRSLGFASIVVAMGVTTALEPMAAQAIGAGDHGRAWRCLVANLKAALLLWVPCVAAGFVVTLGLAPLGVDPAVVARVRLYLLGQSPGFGAMLVFLSTKTFLQAHGTTRPALLGSLAANFVNVFASNLLVRGDGALVAVGLRPVGLPALGALGGGIAFSISCVVLLAFTAMAALAYRPKDAPVAAAKGAGHEARKGATQDVPLREVYRLGLPTGFQMLAEMGIFSLVALLSGVLGPEVASAHQVAIGMASFTFMGALGVSGATAVRVGNAVGAGRSARPAGVLGIGLGAAVMSVGAIVFLAFPRFLVSAFTSDPRVIAIGVDLVRIAALFQLFDGVQAVAAGALRGAGDVRFPFLANVVAHWFVGFPVALTFGFALHLGAPGMWWGLTAGLVGVSTALALRFASISRRAIARV
ncbi:MAG TPA: MATE family efflux transporter [Polyangiaceae bacterium]|jgi:MATE family multidrug resistance protein